MSPVKASFWEPGGRLSQAVCGLRVYITQRPYIFTFFLTPKTCFHFDPKWSCASSVRVMTSNPCDAAGGVARLGPISLPPLAGNTLRYHPTAAPGAEHCGVATAMWCGRVGFFFCSFFLTFLFWLQCAKCCQIRALEIGPIWQRLAAAPIRANASRTVNTSGSDGPLALYHPPKTRYYTLYHFNLRAPNGYLLRTERPRYVVWSVDQKRVVFL